MGKQSPKSHPDLAAYCEAHPELRERFIASSLEMDPARFSKLKSPANARKYGVRPSAEEAARIAKLLRIAVSDVVGLYERAA